MTLEGQFEPRFAGVAQAFEANFTDRGDIGAALAVVERGRMVVDIWAGRRDAGKSLGWQQDTLVNVWSTTKGVTAICTAMLVDRGLLDFDARVADYWPEFGQHGKTDITLRMLLSHQAGLCGFKDAVNLDTLYDARKAANRLAESSPFWRIGEGCGYHAITVGFLINELFIRVDGRSTKEFVHEELFLKSGLDIHIGLPSAFKEKSASLLAPESLGSASFADDLSAEQISALANPPLSPELPNTPAWQAAEIPSANGFATAHSLATLYGSLVSTDTADPLVSPATLDNATQIAVESVDRVLGIDVKWAAGFLRNSQAVYGPSASAFGHSGWGGSFAFADPQRQLGVAYVMNKMGTELVDDPRNVALIDAIYDTYQ
ncbi:MAG: serine hydrolase domain-containing protein [Pseudomonadota bacterium]